VHSLKRIVEAGLGKQRASWIGACKLLLERTMHDRTIRRAVGRGQFNFGFCPICATTVAFVRKSDWLRDNYRCLSCNSIPRQRALITILDRLFPRWRSLHIHESSPGGPSSDKLTRECKDYSASQFFPTVTLGTYHNGVRCENLERLTFPDATFDLLITQDVFEHVMNPSSAFAEVARVLKPGGAHVFTVPYFFWKETVVRAVASPEGIKYLQPPDYHGNPIDDKGSLVVTEWGPELIGEIYCNSGMITAIHNLHDVDLGLEAEFLEVFVSRKPDGRPGSRRIAEGR
jgi:SAM-dependent methyltransferase